MENDEDIDQSLREIFDVIEDVSFISLHSVGDIDNPSED
jgi:hypothetical protein